MNQSTETIKLDRKALDALIARVQHAIDNDLALSVEDMQLLLHAILTLCTLQEKMEQHDITLTKLRKLLGIVRQSERRSDENRGGNKQKPTTKKNKRPKRSSSRRTPTVVHHKITEFERGQLCPVVWVNYTSLIQLGYCASQGMPDLKQNDISVNSYVVTLASMFILPIYLNLY